MAGEFTIDKVVQTPYAKRQIDQYALEKETEAKYEDVDIWEMSTKLDNVHHVFSDYTDYYAPDENFALVDKADDIKMESEYVQNAVTNLFPQSQEQYDMVVEKSKESEKTMEEYSQLGATGFTAHMLSAIRDPAALAIGVGTGFVGVGAKVAKTSRTLATVVDGVIAEGAISASKLNTNPTYGVQEALIDIAVSPVTAFVPAYIGGKLSPIANRMRKARNEQNGKMYDIGEEMQKARVSDGTLERVQTPEEYKTAFLKIRLDRMAQQQKSEFPEIRALQAYDDAVGMFGDIEGQGFTAEGLATMHRDHVIPRFNKMYDDALNDFVKAKKFSGRQKFTGAVKKDKAIRDATEKIIIAQEMNDLSLLDPHEMKLYQAMNDSFSRSHAIAKSADVKGAQDFEHSSMYTPIQYDAQKLLDFPEQSVIQLFTRAFSEGSQKVGGELAEVDAQVLGKVMFKKITDRTNVNAISEMIDDPEVMAEVLSEMRARQGFSQDEYDVLDEYLKKLSAKTSGDDARFKSRANLNRAAKITLEDGSELRMTQLMNLDPVSITHGYANRMTAHAGIAEGMGFKSAKELTEHRAMIGNKHGQKALDEFDEIMMVVKGYPSYNVSDKFNKFASVTNSIGAATMLGNSGIVSSTDVAIQTARFGLAATIKAMPFLPKSMRGNDFEALTEMMELEGLSLESPYLMTMYNTMAEDALQGSSGKLDTTTRNMATATLRASFQSSMTGWAQKTAYLGAVRQSFKNAKKGKDISLFLAETGWTKAQKSEFKGLLETTPNLVKDGKDMVIPDMSTWTKNQRSAFLKGVYRYSLRAASRTTRGEALTFFEHPASRIILQFRQILFSSITKRAMSGLTRLHVKGGMKLAVQSTIAQAGFLYIIAVSKAETKMAGMSNTDKRDYVKKLGFKNMNQYQDFFFSDPATIAKTIMDADPKLIRNIGGYSPSHGGLMEVTDIVASALGQNGLGSTRYKPVEDTALSIPIASFVENVGRTLLNTPWDGEVSPEEARRLRSVMWMNGHPIIQAGSNMMIEAADLPDKKK
jgi:hypothetical protein